MMDKTKYKTLSIALELDTLAKLNEYCEDRTKKSIFVRGLIKRELNRLTGEKKAQKKNGRRVIKVVVDDYDTLREYAEAKKLRNVKTLLPFVADRYMALYPLKDKKQGKSLKNANSLD